MGSVMMASTVIDLLAVAGLGWLVWRSGRERALQTAEQRAALSSLQGDLAQLVRDAEQRARTLDETLAAREEHLRDLLRQLEAVEAARRPQAAPAARPTDIDEPASRDAALRLGIDPAEARLLRDLQVSFAGRRA